MAPPPRDNGSSVHSVIVVEAHEGEDKGEAIAEVCAEMYLNQLYTTLM